MAEQHDDTLAPGATEPLAPTEPQPPGPPPEAPTEPQPPGPGTPPETPEPEPPRGFSLLSIERRREIASSGGRASHAKGTAHRFQRDSEEAKAAGRKGAASRNAGRTGKASPNGQ